MVHPENTGLRVAAAWVEACCQRVPMARTRHGSGLGEQGWEKLLGSGEGTSGAVCKAGPCSEPQGSSRDLCLLPEPLLPCHSPFPR